MDLQHLKLIIISTPIGFIGSGRGGGVELTLVSIVKGLLEMGYEITIIASEGSSLPSSCQKANIIEVKGVDQVSWQQQKDDSPIEIPMDGILPKFLEIAINLSKEYDAILNLSYDWLPIWITPYINANIFHLISMGGVSKIIKNTIKNISETHHSRLAFHTYTQASDYRLEKEPIIVGNGFDFRDYDFQANSTGPIGWAGRVAPEKGLEDAAKVAASLGDTLLVWGFIENNDYASKIEASVPPGTIEWRGFLNTHQFQSQMGACRVLINTPKWNEAYGNVVMEAMGCGVPVVAYNRGGPGELIKSGVTGWLVPPDDIDKLREAVLKANKINRKDCREWAIQSSSYQQLAKRIHCWITNEIAIK
ncbi:MULTISPECIES: glycosyltransferase family 4 protein [unclassified Prochlorococcus]|uniref:glycosyltransferase family 4 protein n=1 Tax=unclassified Prochlorococcus TaxID=2627481 RepID=UPI0005336FCD|nr:MULTISPECIES: glycosyltransferase family 4 protein [unclassified Prochlorococcus]KGG16376.1 Glycosyltransferase [Prochlorococcus sp. MIT 0603]KGG17890.1 Glycosyltransferase [Prochlorococcus sp. MIT 0602]